MKCPLFNRVNYTETTELGYEVADCLKEECAWWDEAAEQCIVHVIPYEINRVGSALQDIRNNMPHEAQFRK